MAIQPVDVGTFDVKPQTSTLRWRWVKGQGSARVHPQGTMNASMPIHFIVFDKSGHGLKKKEEPILRKEN